MKKLLLLIFSIISSFGLLVAQSDGDYQSNGTGGGDWSDASTWQIYSGGAYMPATVAPSDADGIITVVNGDIVTVSTIVIADQLIVRPGGNLTVATSGSLTINNGTDAVYTPSFGPGIQSGDIVVAQGTIFVPLNGAMQINGTFIYTDDVTISNSTINTKVAGIVDHDQNGGSIMVATWQTGSTIQITGMTNTTPTGLNQLFYNFEWNCTDQTMFADLANQIPTIQNDFIINSTGVSTLFLNGFGPGSMDVGHDLIIGNNGSLTFSSSDEFILSVTNDVNITAVSSFGMVFGQDNTSTLNIGGDMTISNNFILALSLGTGSGNINIEGDFLQNGGSFSGNGTLTFNGNGVQNVNLVNNPTADVNFEIESGSIVDIGTSYFSGPGDLTLHSGGTLRVGSPAGTGAISASTAAGNVRLSGTRTYQSSSTIVYSGTSAQFIGSGHPANPRLELDNSNNVTLVNDVTVNGNVILTAGDLIINDNILTLGNSATANGNHIQTTDESSLVFNGNGAFGNFPFESGAQFVNNVTVNRTGGSVTFDAPVTIEGDLTLTAGSLRFSDLTHNGTSAITSGNLYALSDASLFIGGSGAYGNLSFAAAGNTLNVFTLERTSGTTTLTSAMNIASSFTLSAGTFANPSGLLAFVDGATFFKDSNADITGLSPNVTSGTYNVTYTGVTQGTGPEIPVASDENSLGLLTLNGGPVTLDQELYINGGILFNSGTLASGGNTIYVRGNWTKIGGGFDSDNSTVVFDGTTIISGSSEPNFGDIQITNDADVTFPTGNINITDFLQIDAGATFNANGGTVVLNGDATQIVGTGGAFLNNITVNKGGGDVNLQSTLNLRGRLRFQSVTTFASAGNLVLVSTTDAEGAGNGSIGSLANGATVTGNVTVQRYMSQEGLGSEGGLYRYISSSVSNATVSAWQDDFPITGSFSGTSTGPGLTDNYSMFIYNESATGDLAVGYVGYPYSSNTETLEVGKGYAAWVFDDSQVTIDVTGTINSGDVEIPVTRTASGITSADGWNLVGNPYPSSIDWDNAGAWDKTDVYGTIAVRDNGNNGIYHYWNGTDAGGDMRTELPDGRIATGQAFWVNAANNGSLYMSEAAKTATTAEFFREDTYVPNRLIVALDKGTSFDEALVVISPDATNGYDPDLDIPKFSNSHFNLSTFNSDGKDLAYNFLKTSDCDQPVGIDINGVSSGEYVLSFRKIETFEDGYSIMLYDNYTGTSFDVSEQQSYTFTVDEEDEDSFGSERFRLVINTDITQLVDVNTPVEAASTVCTGENATITLPDASSQVSYQLTVNDEVYGDPVYGSASGTAFEVANNDLKEGDNIIGVMATISSCSSSLPLETEITITKAELEPVITVNDHMLSSNYAEGNQWYFNDELIEGATGQQLQATMNGNYSLEVTSNGCTARVSEELIVTGADDLFNGQIRVYPNPTAGDLKVYVNFADVRQNATLTIYNSIGELMMQKTVTNKEYNLDLTNWKSGMYLMQIVSEGEVQVRRLIRK